MPQWSNPDTGDDDQDKVNAQEPTAEEEPPLFATFMWWLVVFPLAVAIVVLLAIRYHHLIP